MNKIVYSILCALLAAAVLWPVLAEAAKKSAGA
jgi:hypothetical protein